VKTKKRIAALTMKDGHGRVQIESPTPASSFAMSGAEQDEAKMVFWMLTAMCTQGTE
jgi:hypothetical protein